MKKSIENYKQLIAEFKFLKIQYQKTKDLKKKKRIKKQVAEIRLSAIKIFELQLFFVFFLIKMKNFKKTLKKRFL